MYSGQTINDGSVVWKVKDLRDTATQTENGLMSAADKTRLDNMADNANNYTLPTAGSSTKGGVKVSGSKGLAMSSEEITLVAASANTLGGVKVDSSHGLTNTNGAISLAAASPNTLGGVRISGNSSGIVNSSGVISLANATASSIGGVKIGSGINVSSGVISVSEVSTTTSGLMTASDKVKLNGIATGANAYTLPNAGTTVIGGVRVASASTGISLTSGAISLCSASTSSIGGVKIKADDGIKVNSGVISLGAASSETLGGVRVAAIGTSNISLNSGNIAVPIATTAQAGVIKLGNGVSTASGGVITIQSATTGQNGLMTSSQAKMLESANAEVFAIGYVSVSSGQLFYNGQKQKPTLDFDQSKVSIVGGTLEQSVVSANGYNISIKPAEGYHWRGTNTSDTSTKTYTWNIKKANPESFLSEQAVFLRPDNDKVRIEVESDAIKDLSTTAVTLTLGSTTATLVSNTYFEAEVITDGTIKEIEFRYKAGPALSGSGDLISNTDLTVNIGTSTNYNASTVSMRVHTSGISGILAHNSITDIKAATTSGHASQFWAVGDIIGPVPMAGTISTGLELNDYEAYFYILGFDHNSTLESTGKDSSGVSAGVYHTITFQFGKSGLARDSVSVAFVDDHYGQVNFSGDGYFRHHTTNTNAGGWAGYDNNGTPVAGSDLRTNNCVWFYNALPNDWQNAICPIVKYTDNHGGGTDTDSYVTASYEKVFLLAEYEVFGSRSYANSAEQNSQARYTYFANGNSSVKYRFDDISVRLGSTEESSWTTSGRSVRSSFNYSWINEFLSHAGHICGPGYTVRGFAPAFCIGTMTGVVQSDIIALPS